MGQWKRRVGLNVDWDDKEQRRAYFRERTKAWRDKHGTEVELARNRLRQAMLKDDVYAAYGGYVCNCCGETEPCFLSIDHVNNDGADHRRHSDRRKLYQELKNLGFPSGFQVLCMNCNFGKARNDGICPHKLPEGSTTILKRSSLEAQAKRGTPIAARSDEDIVCSRTKVRAVSEFVSL